MPLPSGDLLPPGSAAAPAEGGRGKEGRPRGRAAALGPVDPCRWALGLLLQTSEPSRPSIREQRNRLRTQTQPRDADPPDTGEPRDLVRVLAMLRHFSATGS